MSDLDLEKNKFAEKFKEAKLNYLHNLPDKIAEIKLTWEHLNKVEWRLGLLLKMQNLCHNLAGSGGTFGFPQLSEQAKNLELALNTVKYPDDETPEIFKLQKIDDLLMGLQEVELLTLRENEPSTSPIHKSDTIFIIDPDIENAISMSRQLMYYGCKVKIINDLSSLNKGLKTAYPLTIIIDSDMAEKPLNNKTIMQTMQDDWEIRCPIVYISTKDDFESRMRAIKANASAYFTKPTDISLLVERINILSDTLLLEPYRILIVEDDQELAEYYALILERSGIRAFVETKPELALNAILRINPELVVMDLHMPHYSGIDLIRLLRQHQSLYSLPIVLLTSETDLNVQFLAREVGVDDFLMKPIEATHFHDSVLNRVQRARYTNASMSKDSLTGLFVHKKINEFLQMSLNLSSRYNRHLSYAILDIDDFKKVNDTYGHLMGDNILVALSNLLKTHIRSSDFVGRYGGEEFVIIFPETSEADAFKCIELKRKEFAEMKHYAKDEVFHVTFSAGLTSFPEYSDMESIMAEADKALYYSKSHGKNRTTIAD